MKVRLSSERTDHQYFKSLGRGAMKVCEFPAKYGIAEYQAAALSEFLKHTSFEGKRVLEVGGSNLPSALVFDELGAKEWVCVDIIGQGGYQLKQQLIHYASCGITPLSDGPQLVGSQPYLILDGCIEDAGALPNKYFDAVISITSFEHVLAYSSALNVIKKLKKDDAPFHSYHGPIWSCSDGHHIWVSPEINFIKGGAIGPFEHLLYTPPQLFEVICTRFGKKLAEETISQVYHQPRVNRLFFEDHEQYLRQHFLSPEITGYGVVDVPTNILERLINLYPRYRRFDAYGMIVYAF